MTDSEEQNDELLALSEILERTDFLCSMSEEGLNTGVMSVTVNLVEESGLQINTDKDTFTVSHLPPVSLSFTLPPDYPSLSPPSVVISCPWLHTRHITKLQDQLLALYQDQGGGVVLFTWLSFMQEELLAFLGMETEINTSDLVDLETLKGSDSPEGRLGETTTEMAGEPSASQQQTARLLGTVKKWKQEGTRSGHGYIRAEGNNEWSFQLRDCILTVRQSEEPLLFSKGDRVSFEENRNSARKTRKAVNVKREDDDDCDSPDQASGAAGSTNCDKTARRETESKLSKHHKIITLLREFNQLKKDEKFSVSLHSCDICFSDKVGGQCVQFLGCDHVYCKDCMSGYLNVRIGEGAVSNLNCPTEGCTTQILPNQVSDLVSEDLYQKYERILLETQLESMADVVLCPRLACQCPTIIDRETNMAQCSSCSFAFCIYCRQTYHGVSPCKMKSAEQRVIIEKYNNSQGPDRIFMEQRYGKKQLERMAVNLASEEYLADNARHCPHCNAPIEKNEGCNKLPKQNPYSHFNFVGGDCYGALFQGVDPGEEDDDDEFEFF